MKNGFVVGLNGLACLVTIKIHKFHQTVWAKLDCIHPNNIAPISLKGPLFNIISLEAIRAYECKWQWKYG